MNLLVPMAGADGAFARRGHSHGKALAEIGGKALIEHVWDYLKAIRISSVSFVIRRRDSDQHRLGHVLKLMVPDSSIILAEGETAGAACTALLAIEKIDNNDELVIANGDQVILRDLNGVIDGFRDRGLDAGVVVFDDIHPRWSFVRLDGDQMVIEAAEKKPISRMATAGFYSFRRGCDFVDGARRMILKDSHVDGRFFVCPVLNELVLRHMAIGIHQIPREQYWSLATPRNIEQFDHFLNENKKR